jgi:hypothetical protein
MVRQFNPVVLTLIVDVENVSVFNVIRVELDVG